MKFSHKVDEMQLLEAMQKRTSLRDFTDYMPNKAPQSAAAIPQKPAHEEQTSAGLVSNFKKDKQKSALQNEGANEGEAAKEQSARLFYLGTKKGALALEKEQILQLLLINLILI